MPLDPSKLPALLGGAPAFPGKLPIVRPVLPPLDPFLRDARQLLESGMLTNARYVREFERRAAERLGVPECVAVSSCTLGLTLTLRALDLEGEVILPSFTFFATGHAVLWNGLTPVLADCEPGSFNLDPAQVKALIGPRTAAIVATHLFGNPAPAEALERLAEQHGLRLIFDAAHAFGSRRAGRPVGSFGEAEVFSFTPTKLLVAGEGGLVATRDRDLAARLRAARNYGDAGDYDPALLGLNARMPELNALLALHGLDQLDETVELRNQVASRYIAGLSELPGLSFQTVRPGDRSTYKDFSIVVEGSVFGLSRDDLAVALAAENMEVRKYFDPPLHEQKLYRRFHQGENGRLAVTEKIAHNVLSFPIYASLAAGDAVEKVVDAVARIHACSAEVAAACRDAKSR